MCVFLRFIVFLLTFTFFLAERLETRTIWQPSQTGNEVIGEI